MAQYDIYQDDCFSWLAGQPDNHFAAVITDPPYGVFEYEPNQVAKLKARDGGVWRLPPQFDGASRAPLPRFTVYGDRELRQISEFFERFGKALIPKLRPGAHVFMAASTQLSHLAFAAMTAAGLERRGEIARIVRTMRGGDRPKNAHEEFPDLCVSPRSCWEPWGLFRKPIEGRVQDNLRKWRTGCLKRVSEDTPFLDLVQSERTPKRERAIARHPSIKPQSFLRHLVRHALPFDDGIILDPFAGSGSTIAACLACGIDSVGIERDPDYFRMAELAIPELARIEIEQEKVTEQREAALDPQLRFVMERRVAVDEAATEVGSTGWARERYEGH